MRTLAFMITCVLFVYLIAYLVRHTPPLEHFEETVIEKDYEIVQMEVTAYCPCVKCCGDWSDGHFADGSEVGGKAIAADPAHYDMGTEFVVPGYGTAVMKDVGGAIKGAHRLDLYFDKHNDALVYGHQYNVNVKVRK